MSDATDLEYVRQVLERHKDEILKTYRAVGVGIGKRELTDPGYVIMVYLESAESRPATAAAIEGVPLKFEVTGPFTPMSERRR